jgi:microcompartment protein CcmL/EutN
MRLPGDSLGLLETQSIAAGVRAADEVLKAAPVELIEACPISGGKFLVIFGGDVASVEAALAAGRRAAEATVVDELFLAQVHPEVAPAVARRSPVPLPDDPGEALGVVETLTCAAVIVGADAAAKAARVRLLEIALGRGIGGRGYFTMVGDVATVTAGAEAARTLIDRRGAHVRTEILAGPHVELRGRARRLLLRPGQRLGGEDGEDGGGESS